MSVLICSGPICEGEPRVHVMWPHPGWGPRGGSEGPPLAGWWARPCGPWLRRSKVELFEQIRKAR
jgi:hypothetical protein